VRPRSRTSGWRATAHAHPTRHVDARHGEEHDVVHAKERVARTELALDVQRGHFVALHHVPIASTSLPRAGSTCWPGLRDRSGRRCRVRLQIDEQQGRRGERAGARGERPLYRTATARERICVILICQ